MSGDGPDSMAVSRWSLWLLFSWYLLPIGGKILTNNDQHRYDGDNVQDINDFRAWGVTSGMPCWYKGLSSCDCLKGFLRVLSSGWCAKKKPSNNHSWCVEVPFRLVGQLGWGKTAGWFPLVNHQVRVVGGMSAGAGPAQGQTWSSTSWSKLLCLMMSMILNDVWRWLNDSIYDSFND